jgi:arabinofuranosyltransferase
MDSISGTSAHRWNPRRLMVLSGILLFVLFAFAFSTFKVDDAYISFVYAKNLIQGNGLTYNGIGVEDYSNFLWTLLVAPFIALNFDPLVGARGLSLLSGCVILVVIEKLIRQFSPGISNWGVFLTLAALALNTAFAAWTMGGLETILIALWVTLFVYWERQPGQRADILSRLVVLAAALTRPEGALLFPLLVLYRLIYKRQPFRQVLLASWLFALPFGLYLFWRYLTYGYWIPNTAYLKLARGWETTLKALPWLAAYWAVRPFAALLVAIAAARLLVTGALFNRDWGLVTLTVLAFVAFVLYAGPDWMPHHRFLVPIIPLLSLFLARALVSFSSGIYQELMFAILVVAILLEVIFAAAIHLPYAPQFGEYTEGLIRAGKWIRQATSPQDVIAVIDAGALAYYSERRTIDILGLNDEHIAHLPDKTDPAYVLAQHPKVVQLHIAFSATGQILSSDNNDNNWQLFNYPGFQQAYSPWLNRITTDLFFPFLFVRPNESD